VKKQERERHERNRERDMRERRQENTERERREIFISPFNLSPFIKK
jgi:hypothetical protein